MKKKMTYNSIIGLFIAGILAVGTSCVSENAEEHIIPVNDSFTMRLATGNSFTRALPTENGDADGSFNENKISSLDLFFYDGTTLKWHVSSSGGGITYEDATKTASISVAADKRALFNNNTTVSYDVYVVANNSADISSITEGNNNLSALQNLVFQSAGFVSNGGSTAQSMFVMDGKISQTVNLSTPDLGTINLKRAASKIRMRVVEVDVPDYTLDGTIMARLVHFTDKSALMEGGVPFSPTNIDWKDTSSREVNATYNTNELTTAAPFYAYSNDWTGDASKETYIELYVPLKNQSEETETYKYYVPLTPQNLTGEDAQYMNKLQRNFLYDIAVGINILGSIEEPPVTVSGNYQIIDWNTQNVAVDIKGMHYLVVSERNVTMPNVNSYTLVFNSSIANVWLVSGSLKATYTYINIDNGQQTTANCTGSQIPTITVQSNTASGTITISSVIPVNFIPKDIEFKITNGVLEETITVRQLGGTYFTSEKGTRSNLRNQLESNHNNPYMYQITTLAPDGTIVWGFPPLDNNGNTVNSAEVANMVSPRFMMASQLGATSTISYSDAVNNCRNYWEETTIDGATVRYDDWRLPTEAEIKYIDDLQHDANSLQGIVMRGNYYWDAYDGNNAYQMKDPVTNNGSPSSAHVRCVRDIKD